MDSQFIILMLVLGGSNYLLRFVPAVLLNKFSLPKIFEEWLSFVPVATMAAIVVPSVINNKDNEIFLSIYNLNLISAIPTIIVAWKTKNLGYSLATGMITMALLHF